MNLVDSCGWLEYITDGRNAEYFAPVIEDLENLIVPSICLYEVFKVTLRERGEEKALEVAANMQQAKIIDMDSIIALNAAKIGFDLKLPTADSIIMATALTYKAKLWTQDEHFQGLDNVSYIHK